MAVDLIFSIRQEIRNSELFFVVDIAEKGSSRILYIPSLKEFGRQCPELVQILIQERCREAGITPLSHQITTLSCNTIRVRASKSLDLLQKLILSRKLLWKGKSLFFNPLSRAKLSLEVENISETQSLSIQGFLEIEGTKQPISSADFIFLSTPVWGIHRQMVFVLPEQIRPSWLGWIYPESKQLSGKQRERFLEDFKEDPPEDFPQTAWKGFSETKKKTQQVLATVFPCLVLKDLRGAFADLRMDYPSRSVDFHDSSFFEGRDFVSEKSWEKDLLETDYRKKDLGTSHYYCPMDKVTSSLSFLLEIGWKILDAKGRQVVRASSSDLSLSSSSQGTLVKGAVRYGDHIVDVKNVVGAFTRQDRFVEVSPGHVGLLDDSSEYQGIEELSETEIVAEGCLVRPKKWGLLDSLLDRQNIVKDLPTQSLSERILQITSQTEMPSMPDFKGELRSYQEAGVQWLYFLHANQLSGLLADEMGLGKTVQTLAFFSAISWSKPLLIVVPTSLVFNWKKEWAQFIADRHLYVHEGSKRSLDLEFLQKQEAIITSYSVLRMDFLVFQKLSFSCILLDEAQWIKNPDSQISQVIYSLSSETRIALTGTPIENRAEDLWSIFHFLEPEVLGEKKQFLNQLQAAEQDSRYKKRLQKLLKPFILRRLKEEVAKDLPEKMEQIVWIEMKDSQRDFYENFLRKTKAGLLKKVSLEGASSHRMEILEAILRLRQICCHPALIDKEVRLEDSSKMQRVLEDLEEVVQEKRKVLVYSQFTQMLHILRSEIEKRGWGMTYLDGDTKDRESAVVSFQQDPSIQIFLISLKAGGVGLNLTAADYVFLFDPWWNEAVERQAIDRAHRFGRQGAVIARRYIMAESIEEKILKLKAHKLALADTLLSLESDVNLGLEELVDLLQS